MMEFVGNITMDFRVKIVDIELTDPRQDITGLAGYKSVNALVRLYGQPVGAVDIPILNGVCSAYVVRKTILDTLNWPLILTLLQNMIGVLPPHQGWKPSDLIQPPVKSLGQSPPLVTVAVCTRDRGDDLSQCLEALATLDYPQLDILIVDNAPSDTSTQEIVARYPTMRYTVEPRPGLDWARNRAIIEAKGEIVAYTDDDVVVSPQWVRAIVAVFEEHPEVMAVTGLVRPYELETEAQILFEQYGGFGRGYKKKWYHLDPNATEKETFHLGPGIFGTGANMAYRRSLFEEIGYFDPALDVGTVTNGGGDLEMFFRVLKEGHTLVYEPAAFVLHRHRRNYAQLQTQIANNGIGFYSFLVRSALAYGDERWTILRFGLWWLRWWNVRRLRRAFVAPSRVPRALIWAELKGSFVGLVRYQKARKNVAKIIQTFGDVPEAQFSANKIALKQEAKKRRRAAAVRVVDLSKPITALTDLEHYFKVRVFVTWYDYPIKSIDINNYYQAISQSRLRHILVEQLNLELLKLGQNINGDVIWGEVMAALTQKFMPNPETVADIPEDAVPANVSVSVVVATYDRPDDLRKCLSCLAYQETTREVEIIVVDNNPSSGLTSAVVVDFADVRLVEEPRSGLSYARNRGIVESRGDIVIATDDDVTMPLDWLEKLIKPFARPEVMIVTGNVLPAELETQAQQKFEDYGGLGRGFTRFEVDRKWFESFKRKAVPTWDLGATANAAFRATIFHHPDIDLMHEALGAGSPTGCSEDTFLFYQVLKAGYTIVYEPYAYVWHNHRRTMDALRKQIFNYSKGHIAYHLLLFFRYRDFRALYRIFVELPRWQRKQLWRSLKRRIRRKKGGYPLSLTLLEIRGNFIGPWSLWQSYRQVKQKGRSAPYVPVPERIKSSALNGIYMDPTYDAKHNAPPENADKHTVEV
ncbi:MAG: glycosyltransferase [Chloroflexota bacterium]